MFIKSYFAYNYIPPKILIVVTTLSSISKDPEFNTIIDEIIKSVI